MKKILLLIAMGCCARQAGAQITITASDMPVVNDTLRYSAASPVGATINPGDSGTNFTWDYSSLVPMSQGVDHYQSALSVSITYALISFSAYGYKIADSIPGSPVPITNVYTFFQKITSPNSYAAVAFGASISGLPTPANYSTNDTWYFFPLSYGNSDSSDYALNVSLATLGSLKRVGYRKTRVDGWGTIVTPYATTPVNCIRVRSEIDEIDSVSFGTTTFGLPNNTVEYKWLANGEHYPLLWVTSNVVGGSETISSIRYRDIARAMPNEVPTVNGIETNVKAYPVPAIDGIFHLDVPASWNHFHAEVFDINGRMVLTGDDLRTLNLQAFATGSYVARLTSGGMTGFVQLVK